MRRKHHSSVRSAMFLVTCAAAIALLAGFTTMQAGEAAKEQYVVSETKATPVLTTPSPTLHVPEPTILISEAPKPTEEPKSYSEEDLDLLARLITAEMGCSWVPDDIQLYVGSVVLNRMESSLFPDTLYDVIYQKGQYSPTWSGAINNTPDERTVENARTLLENGSVLPANVVFQANFKQGDGVYAEYYDEYLGTTTYFCYLELA